MRVLFNSASTEKKDREEHERYRQDEERQRQDQFRRDDLDQEKGIWHEVLQARIDQGWTTEKALADADRVLAAYRERFQ